MREGIKGEIDLDKRSERFSQEMKGRNREK